MSAERLRAPLWGLHDLDAEDCAQRLNDVALLALDLGRGVLTLHDVMRAYLVQHIPDVSSVHTRLVEAYGDWRRRLSAGLLVQASYQFAKALSNSYSSSATVFSNPRTLRDQGQDKAASPWDIRHSFKVDWIYELPVGPGKHFLATNNPVFGRLLEGWQFGGVATVQAGPSMLLQSGRYTYDQSVAGNTPVCAAEIRCATRIVEPRI